MRGVGFVGWRGRRDILELRGGGHFSEVGGERVNFG